MKYQILVFMLLVVLTTNPVTAGWRDKLTNPIIKGNPDGLERVVSFQFPGTVSTTGGVDSNGGLIGAFTTSSSTTAGDITTGSTNDGAVVTFETIDMNDAGAADFAPFGVASGAAIGDGMVIGYSAPFSGVYFNGTTATVVSTDTRAGKWQYSTAEATWADLTVSADNTVATTECFEQDGFVFFNPPTDWGTTLTLDGPTEIITAGTARYFIRYVITDPTIINTYPTGDQIRMIVPATANCFTFDQRCSITDVDWQIFQTKAGTDNVVLLIRNITAGTFDTVTITHSTACGSDSTVDLYFDEDDELSIQVIDDAATPPVDVQLTIHYTTQFQTE